jgi:hypothetical protein
MFCALRQLNTLINIFMSVTPLWGTDHGERGGGRTEKIIEAKNSVKNMHTARTWQKK